MHAGTWVHGNDREGLARLARYGARGPVAHSRLLRLEDGRYEYTPKGGAVRPVVLTAEALVKRLVTLVPPARKHLTTFRGVYGPNANMRPLVVRRPEETVEPNPPLPAHKAGVGALPAKAKKRRRLDWATLQARTFGEDVWRCPCGGRRRVLAVVTSRRIAQEVLQRLGWVSPRKALPLAQGPPQLKLAL